MPRGVGDITYLKGHGFQKGVSGNPGGRSKAKAEMARIIARETEDGAELVAFALAVMRGKKPKATTGEASAAAAPTAAVPADAPQFTFTDLPTDPKSRMYCHNWLTERVAGKAPQDIDVLFAGVELTPQQAAMLEALKMSPHERRQRIEELRARMLTATAAPVTSDDTE